VPSFNNAEARAHCSPVASYREAVLLVIHIAIGAS
jgi:hypothetical protein